MARHHYYQSMIPRFLYGELTDAQARELERHLAGCEPCRRELDETRRLHGLLARAPAAAPTEELLGAARLQLAYALRAERQRVSLWDRAKDAFALPAVYRPAVAFAAAGLLVAGFLGGRAVAPGGDRDTPGISGGGTRVTNVRFFRSGDSGDEIDLAFDAVQPVRLRGRLDSPEIQKVLANVLVGGDNPGVRLRAAGTMAGTAAPMPEPEVRAALLLALKSDENDGVRNEAMRALLRYPGDREVRDALLYVLLNDRNPGLRVAAINGLDTLQARGYRSAEPLRETDRQRLQNDDNMYVRVRAHTILKENL